MYTEFEVFQEKYLKTFLLQDTVKFYKELKTSVVSKHTIWFKIVPDRHSEKQNLCKMFLHNIDFYHKKVNTSGKNTEERELSETFATNKQ